MNATKPILTVLVFCFAVRAEMPPTVQQLFRQVRSSIVVVTVEDRDGEESVMGTGFVVDEAGLIATNLHVCGEARPIWVQTNSGERLEVTSVHASDRTLDLAVLQVDSKAKLNALPLAKKSLEEGQAVVAIGHPLGLKNTVVSGIVANELAMSGVEWWQLAMIIERGNSGGPLLDMDGNVHGVVAMKSTGNEPFGFAIKSHQLKKLLDSPNPIAMAQWKTIGQIPADRWTQKMGARWRQRRGRISVDGTGKGFGGRSLLLKVGDKPKVPYEVAVSVRLDNEAGAAGLVFHADGDVKHYGFYPSNGRLRLTSFEGPSVFNWHVVEEIETPHYQPASWNELKIRVEESLIIGYVNGMEIVRVSDIRQPPGQVGLCKFRQTEAQFKQFRVGAGVKSHQPTVEQIEEMTRQLSHLGARDELLDIDILGQTNEALQRIAILERQAQSLDTRAKTLRELGEDIHTSWVCNELRKLCGQEKDSEIDLLRGALWIAKLDNSELDVESYVSLVESMANRVTNSIADTMTDAQRLQELDRFMFQQHGFHGSRTDYYNAANSHLDRVIDDREGLPLTLSILYIELARKLGLNVVGVGLPGHFVVRHEPKTGDPEWIDVFDRGRRMKHSEAEAVVRAQYDREVRENDLLAASRRDILVRMLANLSNVAERVNDRKAQLRYVEGFVAISPPADMVRLRGLRSVLRHQNGRKKAAVDDLDWILEQMPEGLNLEQVRQMREAFLK